MRHDPGLVSRPFCGISWKWRGGGQPLRNAAARRLQRHRRPRLPTSSRVTAGSWGPPAKFHDDSGNLRFEPERGQLQARAGLAVRRRSRSRGAYRGTKSRRSRPCRAPPLERRNVLVAVEHVVRVVSTLQRLEPLERLVAKYGADALDWLVGLHVVEIAAADRPRLERRRRLPGPLDVSLVEGGVLPARHSADVE